MHFYQTIGFGNRDLAQNERRKYDRETPEGVPCSFLYSSRAGTASSISGAADDKHVLQMAGKYLRLHSVWSVTTPHLSYRPTYSVLLLIWISFGYNVISFYINIRSPFFFFFFPLFLFYFIIFLYLKFLFCFFFVFRNVPCSEFVLILYFLAHCFLTSKNSGGVQAPLLRSCCVLVNCDDLSSIWFSSAVQNIYAYIYIHDEMNLFQTSNFNCVNYRNKARYQNYQTTVFERTECVTNLAPAAESGNSRLERNSL